MWLGGSGVRLTKYQKRRIRDYCLKRDGLKCMICLHDEPNPQNLQIHHKDHHAENHHASNLCLAHVDCNTRAHHGKVGTQLSYPSKRESMMQPRGYPPHPQPLEPSSLEVRLNRDYEPLYRRRSFELVKQAHAEEKVLTKTDLRQQLREFVGCGGPTSYSYDERLYANSIGPLF